MRAMSLGTGVKSGTDQKSRTETGSATSGNHLLLSVARTGEIVVERTVNRLTVAGLFPSLIASVAEGFVTLHNSTRALGQDSGLMSESREDLRRL